MLYGVELAEYVPVERFIMGRGAFVRDIILSTVRFEMILILCCVKRQPMEAAF